MSDKRIVSLTLSLDSNSNNDAVRQFIQAIGLYGMGGFDFQVFEDEEDMIMINGRDAMIETMHDSDEHQEVKEDQVRSDTMEDAAVEDVDVEWPEDPDHDEHVTEQYGFDEPEDGEEE